MTNATQCLADHYQKSFELTLETWRARNTTFLALLGTIGASSLLVFPILGTRSLMFLYLQHALDLGEDQVAGIQAGFPFGMLQAITLFVIFYLTVNLYHRALYVLMSYAYLGALEAEIREEIGVGEAAVAFTRESSFYWRRRDPLLGTVKWVYIILLTSLLVAFLVGVAIQDARLGNWLLLFVDLLFSAPTLLYLYAYAASSVRLDREEPQSKS